MSDETPSADPATPVERPGQEALHAIRSLWWIPLVRGVMLIAIGGYALLLPGVTMTAYATILGVFVLLDGVLSLIAAAMGWVESRWWMVLRGVLGVLVGLFVLAHPVLMGVVAILSLVILLAIQAIVGGVLEIIGAIRERKEIEGEWWFVLSGLLSIAFGGVLLAQPMIASAMLVRILGCVAIALGVVLIVGGFRLKNLGSKAFEAG
ncbi:acid-resistance membrane protein [Planctomycetes bacterium MalM25]|nr:acid-resistance membrane protein [Planctomycetes bacterium MalM25]